MVPLTPLPSVAMHVIVADPFESAVTTPFASTLATFLLEDFHVTAWFMADFGETAAFNFNVAPFANFLADAVTLMLFTA